MGEFIKGKLFTIITVVITVILAGVAVFTAVRLYQLRQESISPTSPKSEPEACGGGNEPQVTQCTSLVFNLTQNSPTPTITVAVTPTVTLTPTVTSTPTPTNTPKPTSTPTPTDKPIGGNDPTPTPTDQPEATSTPTPTPTGQQIAAQISPTPDGATLPNAGVSTPTIFGLFLGLLLIVASLLLAL